ncbi:ATP-dependent DNA helicase Rep [Advenella kashmirensis W13003]|uniref:ATP-dependent DNA helicase Rep n=1 Tax=Advenella kashmirensis W13003 TaxID=1424334 RepID=V8QWE7_9BURK|nr:UvrD-helicase domain-containing protein [Advenella kashmirensis]ETF03334.1 ATP-dependent DNA helicase Rep [Advenella kashmirensis W13003]
MSDALLSMNPAQREAVLYLNGPCLVLAGAGSGKTRVITQKIAYLINECGYDARGIIALTFTNKAAREMAERIQQSVEKKRLKGLTISTFHALGVRFLREEAVHAGLKPGFSILDSTDALGVIQELLATTDKGRLRSVQQQISLWKNALITPDDAEKLAETPDEQDAARVYRSYDATLRAYQSVDFDDLIVMPAKLMSTNDELRERWQRRCRYMLIDEYQDTNVCQYQWVRSLTGLRDMFTAVGDDDQAIYAWRGATIENLAKLPQDYPALRLIKLEQNYRSVATVLDAANQVISRNPNLFGKKLWSTLGKGEPIQVVVMDNEEAEAESVGMRISASRFERNARWKDYAVLYRGNHQGRLFEQTFRELRIPYVIAGGQSFFDKAEIRDIIAYLRIIANEEDDPAFIRAVTTPKRGVGQASLTALGDTATQLNCSLFDAVHDEQAAERIGARQLEPLKVFVDFIRNIQWRAGRGKTDGGAATPAEGASELLDEVMKYIDYERYLYDTQEERAAQSRWQNVLELTNWLKRKAQEDGLTLAQLVQHIALITMLERSEDDEDPDAVRLTTIHASKGLEYPYVHMVGVEEGLLPHLGKDDEYGDANKDAEALEVRIQEERRLMYVGITRAQFHLTLTWCKKRRKAREDLIREPSRFISEMGLESGLKVVVDPFSGMTPKERLVKLKEMLQKKG